MTEQYLKQMVERVSWLAPVDYEILLFYENHDIWASAKVVGANIQYDRQYVNKRLRELEMAGLFENDDGLYELSKVGRGFLSGDVSAKEIEELGPD
jgi:predicted transcriptional regulator